MDANESILNAKLITPLLNGGFDDCAVSGERFEGQDGNLFWAVTIVSATNYRPASDRVNMQCLVSGEDFRCVQVEMPAPSFEVRQGDAVEIDPDVKQGVLGVIRKWENEAKC